MEIPPEIATTDKLLWRMIIGTMSLAVLITICGLLALAFVGRTAPEGLIALGSAAVGALAGLLAPSPGGDRRY